MACRLVAVREDFGGKARIAVVRDRHCAASVVSDMDGYRLDMAVIGDMVFLESAGCQFFGCRVFILRSCRVLRIRRHIFLNLVYVVAVFAVRIVLIQQRDNVSRLYIRELCLASVRIRQDECERLSVQVRSGLLRFQFRVACRLVAVRKLGCLDQVAVALRYQRSITIVLDLDGHGLLHAVIADALQGFSGMLFCYCPLICSSFSECYLAETVDVFCDGFFALTDRNRVLLGNQDRVRGECRRVIDRCYRELEAICCQPLVILTACEVLFNLHFTFNNFLIICYSCACFITVQ